METTIALVIIIIYVTPFLYAFMIFLGQCSEDAQRLYYKGKRIDLRRVKSFLNNDNHLHSVITAKLNDPTTSPEKKIRLERLKRKLCDRYWHYSKYSFPRTHFQRSYDAYLHERTR